jgi:hypothetical protein
MAVAVAAALAGGGSGAVLMRRTRHLRFLR